MAAPAGVLLLCLLVLSGPPYAAVAAGEKATVSVRAVTAISHTDDDFICATLDWWPRDKCNYGMCPWHNSSIINLDLYSPILYNAVKAFNSLRIRLGGSLQDQITYKVGKHYADCPSFRRNDDRLFGFTDGCLAMNRWDELNIFFRRTNTTVTFGLNALRGRRKAAENGSTLHVGGWDGRNARDLMRYTVSKGYRVESWELGNELCAGGVEAKVKAAQYGKDVLRLRRMVEKVYNGTGHLPKVLAPGGFYDGPWFSEMLRVSGPGVVDGVTHHIYNLGSGKDKELINKMQDPYYLDKVAQTFSDMEATVRESGPWSSAWVGESGGAYNSGGKDVSDRFANSFWYLDQLGMSAVFGTKVYCRQALVGGNYCLLNTTTLAPNPDYYSALLWHRLMGPGVLQTTAAAGSPYLRSYAHCSKKQPGVTVLLINLSNSTAFDVTVAGDMDLHPPPRRLLQAEAGGGKEAVCGGRREEYHLSPEGGDIQSQVVLLNGEPLALGPCGQIPELRPAIAIDECTPVHVEPHSIAFVRFTGFKAPACA
ncbi:heparanase-like protein 2 [Aegilops tauschii subsp. strangulata]|uniref:heparanase-like protein 2 n=1 Tax=Aegilops tauschii subsp. strangulata TaxID=200361 RepID=UPI00098AC032|nr:heparanase-like protein 2 [Aegilops tauschii subsp. strangulata]